MTVTFLNTMSGSKHNFDSLGKATDYTYHYLANEPDEVSHLHAEVLGSDGSLLASADGGEIFEMLDLHNRFSD